MLTRINFFTLCPNLENMRRISRLCPSPIVTCSRASGPTRRITFTSAPAVLPSASQTPFAILEIVSSLTSPETTTI